jgi:HD superfamily phosphohydrolase
VTCPVHGTIELRELEARIVESRAFQRLRNVHQLGLADYVFPGGDFSRLSHCLGVLHVAGAILEELKSRYPAVITDEVEHDLRLAALVHDIGHLPFSHTMETALRGYFEERAVPVERAGGAGDQGDGATLEHEEIGAVVLARDPTISRMLSAEQAERIGQIIQGNSLGVLGYPPAQAHLGRLVSSDLDADRIDYLMRTAHHTSMSYGAVDLSYLLRQIRLDDEHRICFRERALNAVDHCLLGRYFDRVTIAFNKTIAGFRIVLEEVLQDLVRMGLVSADKHAIERMIETAEWADFDDFRIVERMRTLRDRNGLPSDIRQKVEAILDRTPPKLVAQLEYLAPSGERDGYRDQLRAAREAIAELNQGPLRTRWYLWQQEGFTITTLGSGEEEQKSHEDIQEEEERPRDVLILETGARRARSIQKAEASLMRSLADKSYFSLRVYVLSPGGRADLGRAQRARLRSALTDGRWRWFFE